MHYVRDMFTSRVCLVVLAALVALPLAACGSRGDSAVKVVVIGEKDDMFAPGIRLSTGGQLARMATTERLVSFDEQGRVIPALADRWIVTDDGLSYIFRLRGGNWRNGDPITSKSAKQALDAAFKSLKGTSLALDLAVIDEVRVMAGRVVEIRLKQAMPMLLQLLAQPELGLLHEGEGSGPMKLARIGNRARFSLITPAALGMPEIEGFAERVRDVEAVGLSGQAAVDQFNEGEVDLVTGGRIQDFPLTRSVGLLRGTIKLDPVTGLFGLQVMNAQGFLAEPANREALAMAINRDGLIEPFGLGGWSATTRIVSPDIKEDFDALGERWSGQSIDERRAVASGRVRQWLAAHGSQGETNSSAGKGGEARLSDDRRGSLDISVWLPAGPGSDMIYNGLAADFRTIGVNLKRASGSESADLVLVDDVARYPSAAWFLDRLACSSHRGLCSQEADEALIAVADAGSQAERARLLILAETELTAANVFIPFGPPLRWSLVRSNVSGFATNAWGWHPLMPLAWPPK